MAEFPQQFISPGNDFNSCVQLFSILFKYGQIHQKIET